LYNDRTEFSVEPSAHFESLLRRDRCERVRSRPCTSVSKACSHWLRIAFLGFIFVDDLRTSRCLDLGAVLVVIHCIILLRRPRVCRHPVASFAALSASSYPSMILWDRI
jgi:hypothetical protein